MRTSVRRLVAVVAFAVVALVFPAHGAALTIDAAAVTLDPKKTDAFAVKGTFAPFDAAKVAEVTVELGAFTQTVPIASFAVKKGKLSYKGAKGVPGLATLTLDTGKGKFAASGKNLALAPFDNPAAFHLAVGTALDDCSTLTFAEVKNKRKLASTVAACGFASAPAAEPDVVFVGTPTEVRVQVAVVDDLALDLASLVLLRLDAALQPIGAPVCGLQDDGSPASGDAVAVDGVFTCRFTMTEPAAGSTRFAVRALRDTVLVLSPSVVVRAVTPLTSAEVSDVMTAQNAASDAWDAAFAELGNTKKARKKAVGDILAIPGVANAGIAADGANIFIEYANGLAGGLDLDPVGDPVPVPFARDAPAKPKLLRAPREARAASTAAPRVGNDKVLIWSAFENENDFARTTTAELQALFSQAPCPKLDVTVLKNEQCTLASIATFQDYGTVVILTHGAQPRADKEVGLMTREKATLQSEWLTYARDIRIERLLVYQGRFPEKRGYFVFFPGFVARQNDRGFPNSVIFAGACSSAGNRSMANTFFALGSLAYLGFDATEHVAFLKAAALSFFGNLLTPGATVTDAFARVPFKTFKQYATANHLGVETLEAAYGPAFGTKLRLERGDGRLAYPCGGPAPGGLVETITIQAGPMAHTVGAVRLEDGVKYRLVVSGTTKTASHGGFGDGFAERDVLYCFDDSTGSCNPPFPDDGLLGFYVQSADEEPFFGDLEGIGQFTDLGIQPYSASHRYEYAWTGRAGKLWLTTYPSLFPDSGVEVTGSYTVEIYRD